MSTKGKQLAILGTALQLGILVGLIGTIIGMLKAFSEMSNSQEMDQQTLADNIASALYYQATGLIIASIGAIILLIVLWGIKYRAPWFRIALWIISLLWLITFPAGTFLGIIVMVYLYNHHNEFAEHSPPGGRGEAPRP